MSHSPQKLTVKQSINLDKIAINKYGIPSLALMENAGRFVAEETLKVLRRSQGPKVLIFCGLGNNAGDGFVTARHLINAKVQTKIILIGRADNLKKDALVDYNILKKSGARLQQTNKVAQATIKQIKDADVIIDAIFGVGLNRDVEEPFKSFIQTINDKARQIIAIDVPSGLDGTDGKIHGVCIKADKTVTFTAPKTGFYVNDGPQHVGTIIVADIGIPKSLIKKVISKHDCK